MTTNRDYAKRGGGAVKKSLLAALLAAIMAAALAGAALAVDDVARGRTIEAFIGTNLIDLQGYPANRAVTIEVVRNGVVVGSVSGRTDGTGFVEFNHVGGGQVPAGDCFKPPVTPDVMPGDVIRTKTAGDPPGRFDQATVRDLGIDFDSITTDTNANTITVSGEVHSAPDALIRPGRDVLELRLNKGNRDNTWETGPGLDQDREGRRDLRVDIGANLNPNGTFTRVLRVSNDDATDWQATPGEVALEWSTAVGEAAPPAIFVADEGEGGIAGCPPLAVNAVTDSNPNVINVSNVGQGLRLGGIAEGATGPITVTLNDQNASTPAVNLTATPRDAYVAPHQTWRTDAMTPQQIQRLRNLANGNLTVSASVGGTNLRILKDTTAPTAAPRATPRPGTYPRPQVVTLSSQAGTDIHYKFGSGVPTLNDPVASRPIRITSSRTIRAAAFDAAGNRGPIGTFAYRIR